ncbi:MAG: ATP-binding protein [Planctomycetota bacterium]
MRLLIQLGILWGILAIGLGFYGASVVDGVWRTQMEEAFRKDVAAALVVANAQTWTNPPEAQREWKEMEKQLGVAVIPVRAEGRLGEKRAGGEEEKEGKEKEEEEKNLPGRDASDPPRVEGDLDPSYVGQPVWTQAGKSGQRLSLNVSVANESQLAGANQLRITREVGESPLAALWWGLWAILKIAAGCIGGLVLWVFRHDSSRKKRLLHPWFQALDRKEHKEDLLPSVEAQDSDFCMQMDAVAHSVNQVYASLKNENERSDLVLGNLREGVLAVDDGSRVLLSNKALRRLFELPNDNFIYRPLLEIIRTPSITRMVQKVLEEQALLEEHIEFGLDAKHLRILGRPLPLGDGRVGALLTVRDESLLHRVDMIKKDFVSNASHELKTPLAAIRLYAETLQMGALEDGEAAENFLKKIISQADRLDGLVQGMLQLSRVEVGSALNYQSFDAMQAIEPCVGAAQALADSKGVNIVLSAPDSAKILSDKDGFQTIASNLLSNAVRYTDKDGAVTVRLGQDEKQLTLEVRDTGIGMREADLERIFERFYRAEKDRSVETGGTGLGLAIVKHLTSALGGSVSAESELGEGSCFLVKIPNAPVRDEKESKS